MIHLIILLIIKTNSHSYLLFISNLHTKISF